MRYIKKKKHETGNPIYGPVRCYRGRGFQKASSRRRLAKPNGLNGRRSFFLKCGPAGGQPARPIKVFGGRRHDEKARRKCREKAPSRGQNTSVALASLPATTVAAGGETRARKRASIQPSSN